MSVNIIENGELKKLAAGVADSVLSEQSSSPVQNKVITEEFNKIKNSISEIKKWHFGTTSANGSTGEKSTGLLASNVAILIGVVRFGNANNFSIVAFINDGGHNMGVNLSVNTNGYIVFTPTESWGFVKYYYMLKEE